MIRHLVGKHPCGGDVWYLATDFMGWRVCIGGCGASSRKGQDLDTTQEIAARRAADTFDLEAEERISPTIED